MINFYNKVVELKSLALANIDYLILAILLFIFFCLVIKKLFLRFKARHYAQAERLIRVFGDHPWDFEGFVAGIYESMGYSTELTRGSGDRGKDIIMKKGRHTYAVEVKLYALDHKIDREKIQKLHSAMIDCGADRGIFVTTSEFTDPALDYASKFGIETVDGVELSRLVKSRGLRL